MDFFKSTQLISTALNKRELRNKLISSNIANIDTPFYKARDVDFESALTKEANRIYKKKEANSLKTTHANHFPSANPFISQAITHPNHMKSDFENSLTIGTIFARDGHLQRNDANTVDLDVESTELSKNAVMISALDAALKKQNDMIRTIIDTSSKLS